MPLTYKKKNWRTSLKLGDRVRVRLKILPKAGNRKAVYESQDDTVKSVPKEVDGRWMVELKILGWRKLSCVAHKREPPRFSVGQIVRTKAPVNTGDKVLTRNLVLLPGAEWKVLAVIILDPPSKATATYRIQCSRWVIERREHQLK